MTRKTIRQHRLDAGLTQQQVADALKIDIATVQRWEYALQQPRGRNTENLCKLYGITGSDIDWRPEWNGRVAKEA